MRESIKCCKCGKFLGRPFDSRTRFGCADPEAPEPYDPDFYCRKCSTKKYKELLVKYKCCYRGGDWEKTNAEMKAAKEAGLTWVGSSGLIDTYTGFHINYAYVTAYDLKGDRYMPYLQYQQTRREKSLCKCLFDLEDGNCSRCHHGEVMCLCSYQSYFGRPKLLGKKEAVF